MTGVLDRANSTPQSIRLPNELWERFKRVAAVRRTTAAALIRDLMEREVEADMRTDGGRRKRSRQEHSDLIVEL